MRLQTGQRSSEANALYGIAWSGSQFVAVGDNGTILTSSDGITWTSHNQGYTWSSVVWSGSQFVAAGAVTRAGNPSPILTSPDGNTWTSHTTGTTGTLTDITWSGSQFVVVGDLGKILTSPTASPGTWTSRPSGVTNTFYGIAWSGSQFVVVGDTGKILTSPDGSTWTSRPSGTTNNLVDIAWSGSQFVAVGNGGTILTSPNGSIWTSRSSGTSNALIDIAWSGSQFVVVGNGGTILTSPDGINWTSQSSSLIHPLMGITWSGNQFVAVGFDGDNYGSTTILTSACPWGDSFPLVQAKWSLIGLPAANTSSNLSSLFVQAVDSTNLPGSYGANWRVYKRENKTPYVDQYLPTGPLSLGVGYWMKHLGWSGDVALASGTPTAPLSTTNCPSTVGCYAITLTAAPTGTGVLYNQIGFPLPYPVAWWDVRVEVDGTAYVPSAATTYVNNTYWVWNGSSYSTYNDVTPGKIGLLQPWQGMQVEVKAASRGHTVKLLIPALPKTSQVLPRTEPVAAQDRATPTGWLAAVLDGLITPAVAEEPSVQTLGQRGREAIGERERDARRDAHGRAFQEGREWKVQLFAEDVSRDLRNDDALLGQLDDAKIGYDEYDLPLPPAELGPPADDSTATLNVVFPHPDWGLRAGDYVTDYRPTNRGAPAASWRFEIRTDTAGGVVQLRWDGPAAVLKRSVLLDEDLGTRYAASDAQYAEDGIPVVMHKAVRHFTWRYSGKPNGPPGKD